jgi:hypothetical protein
MRGIKAARLSIQSSRHFASNVSKARQYEKVTELPV